LAAVLNRKIKGLMDDAAGKTRPAVSLTHRVWQVRARGQGLGWLTPSAFDAANADYFLSASLKSSCAILRPSVRITLYLHFVKIT
jgi:hypothetical protein